MPRVEVVFYKEDDGSIPVHNWFAGPPAKVQDKCLLRLECLENQGHQLPRPIADYLRDGIYELRVGFGGVNYRMLYFFHGRVVAVVSHGLAKERRVPPGEIDSAVRRREKFVQDPQAHTFKRED